MASNLTRILLAILICSIVFVCFYCVAAEAAKCEGKVTFYWKETKDGRKKEKRNWGVLKKEIEKDERLLKKFFEPQTAYATTVDGDCCWEVYSEKFFKGESTKLRSGFSGIPNYPQFYPGSLKQVDC